MLDVHSGEHMRSLMGGEIADPLDCEVLPNGNLLVCDTAQHRVVVVDALTRSELAAWCTPQDAPDVLKSPVAATVANGVVVVLDFRGDRIHVFE